MRPRTEKEALDQCKLLWEELARTGGGIEDKYETAERLLGYRPINACPACQWDERNYALYICGACPIKAWRRASKADEPNKCCAGGSPYEMWTNACSVRYRKKYARRVLNLIEESRYETAQEGGVPSGAA